jgi:multiple sugar transport system substrate-binding protein
MRRVVIFLICFAVAITAYAGGQGESMPSDTATGPTEVTIWYYWETPLHQQALGSVVSDFNASQADVVVETEYIPFADFKKQLSIGVVSEALPDIVIIDNPDHASYAAMGIFADITDKVASWPGIDQYYDGPMSSATLNGRLYGIPFGSNCLALFYRDDLLEAIGAEVPTTWQELRAVLPRLTTASRSGLGVSALQNEEGTFQFMPWLWSTGASSFEIGTADGVKALRYYQELITDGSMSKEVINWTQGDVMSQFISGNLAMMVNGPWQVPTMRGEAPDLEWNVALVPRESEFASVLGGENFAVINNDKVDASLAFLRFAVSSDQIRSYINDFGYIAARRDIAEEQFPDDQIMQVFAEAMQYAQPRGPHQRWPEISDAISTAFGSVIIGTATPEQAAANAQETIDEIVNAQ